MRDRPTLPGGMWAGSSRGSAWFCKPPTAFLEMWSSSTGGVLVMNGIRYGGGPTMTNWVYRDGSFVSAGFGTLGRDFHLTGSLTLEFDVTCRGNFNLCVQLYTSTLDGNESQQWFVPD